MTCVHVSVELCSALIELIGNNVLLTQEVTITARGNERNDEELGDNEQTTSHHAFAPA